MTQAKKMCAKEEILKREKMLKIDYEIVLGVGANLLCSSTID